ncbi:alpha/beta fold hydrolase [Cesiribacter andamanensis]|uniref:Dihydrolipoyllysine-residue acetyltransferase component of acetoin cleaving system n=1 Tax=Cesiribacter andamanensis AMV16 TaxID=1279009 RepID=M7NNC8_9BACT|nr:alpha/beta hydrolase [Cesiribacter andamanensis]EMR03230.1 Dihydrolipoyllysine-residue acetyltransferase component of acetoin cleaving system [Cesiribacter andamanensis AMV16]
MKRLIPSLLGTYLNTLATVAPKTAGRHGFSLFCYPVRPSLQAHQRAFLQTAERFTLNQQGRKLQAYRWGSGPRKVLFLHGWQSHSFRWKKYIEALSPDEFSLYALDAPGHGLSEGRALTVPLYSQLIRQFIDQLGEVETVVSHSLGSFSALHALHVQPQLPVQKLVVMGSPVAASSFIDFYSQYLRLGKRAVGLTLQHFEQVIGEPIAHFEASRFARGLQLPGLIVHDEKDQEAPYAGALQLQQVWPLARLLTTRGLDHKLRSPEVVAAVVGYIQGEAELPHAVELAGDRLAQSALTREH